MKNDRRKALYVSLAVFAVCFITLSVTYTPNAVRVEYLYPCSDISYLNKVLPLTCGKIVFTYEQGKVVASVEGFKVDVAKVAGNDLVPVDSELFRFYQYCCRLKYEPRKAIDLWSLTRSVAVAIAVSAIPSLATYALLRKRGG